MMKRNMLVGGVAALVVIAAILYFAIVSTAPEEGTVAEVAPVPRVVAETEPVREVASQPPVEIPPQEIEAPEPTATPSPAHQAALAAARELPVPDFNPPIPVRIVVENSTGDPINDATVQIGRVGPQHPTAPNPDHARPRQEHTTNDEGVIDVTLESGLPYSFTVNVTGYPASWLDKTLPEIADEDSVPEEPVVITINLRDYVLVRGTVRHDDGTFPDEIELFGRNMDPDAMPGRNMLNELITVASYDPETGAFEAAGYAAGHGVIIARSVDHDMLSNAAAFDAPAEGIELVLREITGVVRGRIIGETTRRPMSNYPVVLRLNPQERMLVGDPRFTVREPMATDSNGRFEFDRVPFTPGFVVSHPFLPRPGERGRSGMEPNPDATPTVEFRLSPDSPVAEVEIRVPEGYTVRGKVVHAETGEPIPGVEISARMIAGQGSATGQQGGRKATTNQRGEYSIDQIYVVVWHELTPGNGLINLSGSSPHFVIEPVVHTHPDHPMPVTQLQVEGGKLEYEADFIAHPLVVLSGRVVSTDGSPLAGVSLRASSSARLPERRSHYDTHETDESGSFHLVALANTTATIFLERTGHPVSQESVRVEGDDIDDLEFVISDKLYFAGRVVDQSNRPIVDAIVHLGQNPGQTGSGRTTTDGEGQFVMTSPDGQARTIFATAEGYRMDRHPRAIPQPDTEPRITIVMTEGESFIAGRVLDLEDNPIEGVVIQLVGARHYDGSLASAEPTDDQGRFRFDRLSTAGENLFLRKDGYQMIMNQRRRPALNSEDNVYYMERLAEFTVIGTVVDAETGDSINDFRLSNHPNLRSDDTLANVFTWTATNVGVNSVFRFSVESEGYQTLTKFVRPREWEGDVAEVLFEMEAANPFVLRFVDSNDGTPIAGVSVSNASWINAPRDMGSRMAPYVRGLSDADGYLRSHDLDGGTYRFHFSAPDPYGRHESGEVVFDPEVDMVHVIELVAQEEHTIRFIHENTGAPISNLAIRVSGNSVRDNVRTDEEGEAIIRGIIAQQLNEITIEDPSLKLRFHGTNHFDESRTLRIALGDNRLRVRGIRSHLGTVESARFRLAETQMRVRYTVEFEGHIVDPADDAAGWIEVAGLPSVFDRVDAATSMAVPPPGVPLFPGDETRHANADVRFDSEGFAEVEVEFISIGTLRGVVNFPNEVPDELRDRSSWGYTLPSSGNTITGQLMDGKYIRPHAVPAVSGIKVSIRFEHDGAIYSDTIDNVTVKPGEATEVELNPTRQDSGTLRVVVRNDVDLTTGGDNGFHVIPTRTFSTGMIKTAGIGEAVTLESGEYRVLVAAEGFGIKPLEGVVVETNEETVIEVDLDPEVTLTVNTVGQFERTLWVITTTRPVSDFSHPGSIHFLPGFTGLRYVTQDGEAELRGQSAGTLHVLVVASGLIGFNLDQAEILVNETITIPSGVKEHRHTIHLP